MKRSTPLIVLVAVLLCGVAFAQDATPVAQFFNSLLEPILAAVTAAAGFFVVQGGRYLGGRISLLGNVRLERALQSLNQMAFSKVYEIYQDAVEDIKLAAADGRLTLEEANAAFRTALEELTDALPDWLRKTLLAYAGDDLTALQDRFLSPAIEQAVATMPNAALSVGFDNPDDYETADAKAEVKQMNANLEARKLDSYRRIGLKAPISKRVN